MRGFNFWLAIRCFSQKHLTNQNIKTSIKNRAAVLFKWKVICKYPATFEEKYKHPKSYFVPFLFHYSIFIIISPFLIEFPPPIIDNAKNFSGDELKKKQDEAALIVKTCYW